MAVTGVPREAGEASSGLRSRQGLYKIHTKRWIGKQKYPKERGGCKNAKSLRGGKWHVFSELKISDTGCLMFFCFAYFRRRRKASAKTRRCSSKKSRSPHSPNIQPQNHWQWSPGNHLWRHPEVASGTGSPSSVERHRVWDIFKAFISVSCQRKCHCSRDCGLRFRVTPPQHWAWRIAHACHRTTWPAPWGF